MKFLILGCNGMAGHMISLYLKEQGHDVLGFARTRSALVDSVAGDAADEAFIRELIGVNRFDSVINCIGLLNQFAENDHASPSGEPCKGRIIILNQGHGLRFDAVFLPVRHRVFRTRRKTRFRAGIWSRIQGTARIYSREFRKTSQ